MSQLKDNLLAGLRSRGTCPAPHGIHLAPSSSRPSSLLSIWPHGKETKGLTCVPHPMGQPLTEQGMGRSPGAAAEMVWARGGGQGWARTGAASRSRSRSRAYRRDGEPDD